MAIVDNHDIGLITTEDTFRIRVGEDESEEIGFGEGPLVYDAPNGKTYIAHIDIPEGADESGDIDSLLGEGLVFELVNTGAEQEDEGEGDDDDGDGGETVPIGGVEDEEPAA